MALNRASFGKLMKPNKKKRKKDMKKKGGKKKGGKKGY
tara:strand:- start:1665 stop:1778 length:114 start_codon:yes stop_codon:yes gene_type:complete